MVEKINYLINIYCSINQFSLYMAWHMITCSLIFDTDQHFTSEWVILSPLEDKLTFKEKDWLCLQLGGIVII